MTRPTASCSPRNAKACVRLRRPLASGRVAVRATLASMSRSTMSLTVQPAPRITSAPMPNRTSEPEIGPVAGLRRQGDRPPAGEQQQPGADRPIQPRQPRIGPPAGRHVPVDPVPHLNVGCAAHIGGIVGFVGSCRSDRRDKVVEAGLRSQFSHAGRFAVLRHPKAWPWDPRVCRRPRRLAQRNSWMARPSLAMTGEGVIRSHDPALVRRTATRCRRHRRGG